MGTGCRERGGGSRKGSEVWDSPQRGTPHWKRLEKVAATPPGPTTHLGTPAAHSPQGRAGWPQDRVLPHRILVPAPRTPGLWRGFLKDVLGCSPRETLLCLGVSLRALAQEHVLPTPAAAHANMARWRHLEAASYFTLLYHRIPQQRACVSPGLPIGALILSSSGVSD